MNVDNFLENIIEQIKEAQLKLGYVKEVIRLYFPKDSLCSLLDVSCGSGEELVEKLRQEKRLSDTVLGSLQFSCHGDRIGVRIHAKESSASFRLISVPSQEPFAIMAAFPLMNMVWEVT